MKLKPTKKNHFLIRVDSVEQEDGLKKVGSLFVAPDNKSVIKEYETAEIIEISKVLTEEYQGLYKVGDKIMIHPATKGSLIKEERLVPVDVIFGVIS